MICVLLYNCVVYIGFFIANVKMCGRVTKQSERGREEQKQVVFFSLWGFVCELL